VQNGTQDDRLGGLRLHKHLLFVSQQGKVQLADSAAVESGTGRVYK